MFLSQPGSEQIEEFFGGFLKAGHRRLLSSAARIETARGPGYTMCEIADDLSMDLDDVLRLQRSGRAGAKLWTADGRGAPPIVLEHVGFRSIDDGQGRAGCYRLSPPGVAEIVVELVEHYIVRWRVGEALERALTPRGRSLWATLPTAPREMALLERDTT